MGLSKRSRFEVFKRDDFTCQYCGRKTPAVVLEVDHIVPVSEGGGDERENLVTSCFECNRGKGAVALSSRHANQDMEERKTLLLEREEQLRAYNRVLKRKIKREDAAYEEARNYWFEIRGVDELSGYRVPLANVLRGYIRRLPLESVKHAMRIAYERLGCNNHTPRYFAGVCRGMIAESEGRQKNCTICGGFLILEPGMDTSLQWRHGACAEKLAGKTGTP